MIIVIHWLPDISEYSTSPNIIRIAVNSCKQKVFISEQISFLFCLSENNPIWVRVIDIPILQLNKTHYNVTMFIIPATCHSVVCSSYHFGKRFLFPLLRVCLRFPKHLDKSGFDEVVKTL